MCNFNILQLHWSVPTWQNKLHKYISRSLRVRHRSPIKPNIRRSNPMPSTKMSAAIRSSATDKLVKYILEFHIYIYIEREREKERDTTATSVLSLPSDKRRVRGHCAHLPWFLAQQPGSKRPNLCYYRALCVALKKSRVQVAHKHITAERPEFMINREI